VCAHLSRRSRVQSHPHAAVGGRQSRQRRSRVHHERLAIAVRGLLCSVCVTLIGVAQVRIRRCDRGDADDGDRARPRRHQLHRLAARQSAGVSCKAVVDICRQHMLIAPARSRSCRARSSGSRSPSTRSRSTGCGAFSASNTDSTRACCCCCCACLTCERACAYVCLNAVTLRKLHFTMIVLTLTPCCRYKFNYPTPAVVRHFTYPIIPV
jgi:hypothetical protein